MTTAMEMDHLDKIAADAFEGFLVRKDLVRKYARQYPVPTYVVEFLLGRYCASTDPEEIAEGLSIVEKQLQGRTVRTGAALDRSLGQLDPPRFHRLVKEEPGRKVRAFVAKKRHQLLVPDVRRVQQGRVAPLVDQVDVGPVVHQQLRGPELAMLRGVHHWRGAAVVT